MKTRQEKIKAIYKEIANKDLTFWCKFWAKKEISWVNITFEKWFEFTLIKSRKDENILYADKDFWWPLYLTDFEFENLEIIWHPVMIGDVMTYFNEKLSQTLDKTWWVWKYYWVNERIIILWFNKMTRPIEEQSDGCIDYIYDLLKEE